jgi:hypothetical protein
MIRRGRLLGQALSLVEDEVEGVSRPERLYLGHHEGVKVRMDISLCELGLGVCSSTLHSLLGHPYPNGEVKVREGQMKGKDRLST